MIREAEKYLGYPYVWGGSSPSTSFDCSGFVSWVINNCGNGWSVGRQTANGLKNLCDIIPPSEAKPGDLIFFQGTYNTSGASHVGIYVGNGMMIHCGDPISYLYQTLENKQKFISQIMTSKSPVRSCDDVDEQALSYAEIKALCAGNPLIKEKMDLDIDVARLKVLKADHQSQQYRMEDKLLKYFPAEIEKQTGYIRGFEADIQTVTAHPQIAEGFCGMEILGKHYIEKEDAGEMILAACKEMKTTEPIPLGSYRGFQMELSFDSFRHDFDITLKGAVSHRVSLGTDARGNIIRLDNALSSIPEKLEKAHEQLTNLQNQQEATRAELGKPFPQEAELAEKSARLAELDAALNMEDSMPEREEAEQADKPSVLADLKAKSEHIPPYRASGGREEVL